MKLLRLAGYIILLGLLSASASQAIFTASAQTDGQPDAAYTVGEGFDFATRVLSDPWDMLQFTDLSQWLNHTTISSYDIVNIQIYDGVFSAKTLGSYSEIFPLFPGYEPGMNSGKIGALYPISSNQFQCFSMAMYASWPSADNNYFIITWGPDKSIAHLSNTSYVWGQAYGNTIVRNRWQLYQINLTTHPYINQEPWLYYPQWQLLRVAPSLQPETQFYIDWIRLTDCQPVWVTLSGLPTGATYNLWIGHGSPERQILVKGSFSPASDGTYVWDVQVVEPGTYTYYVKKTSDNTLVQQGTLTVDGTPIASFTRPAPYTGIDYGTSNGNAWDMELTDVTYIACVNYSFANGLLYLDTLPPSMLSDGCVGTGANESDPHIFINTPDHGNLSAYRFLSFDMYQSGSYSIPEKGMIVRLFWQLDRPGLDCWYTSHAIALDAGWHTYSVDMYDSRNGTPEAVTPSDCPVVSWANQASVGPLVQFRIDPNENITSYTFHQEIDWIRLTKVETVHQGYPAEIRLLLNKPAAELTSLDVYYTTDRNQPSQHPAARYTPPTISGPFLQFLPMALRLPQVKFTDPFLDSLSADVVYWWDTTGVSPGTYYVCAVASDGYTTAAYCSQAPFQITAP